MAGNISKNARRGEAKELISRWGGKIVMKTLVKEGKIMHYALCEKSNNTSRHPKDLM